MKMSLVMIMVDNVMLTVVSVGGRVQHSTSWGLCATQGYGCFQICSNTPVHSVQENKAAVSVLAGTKPSYTGFQLITLT